ncbi:TetR/AcrR family transcriptional regulator [Alicyclobacillus dauci]|uniref:TetR/AcrR family transcriptional regulator n=1 Tax=Alicyclobacillus dauci TaxID=1475485 RepID=A0ABY6Z9F5_9BACL|nr:TetR/AcrR family transcriptional regulator [Alicyclobacillus dauci]WAH39340.1 TetR/AcrR family transcriptional regulator [Alicyclobacillus dauci]
MAFVNLSDLGLATPINPTKEKILTVAIDLFSTKGFSAVSIRDITRDVGIRESSLYNHFRNKDDILDTIFVLFRAGYKKLTPPTEHLERILTTMTPAEFLEYGTHLYMTLINDPLMGKIWRIMNVEQYRDRRAREILLQDIIQGTLAFLEAAFETMIRLGSIPSHDPAILASEYQYGVFAMATEYNMLKFANQDTSQIEQRLSTHVAYFLQGLGA